MRKTQKISEVLRRLEKEIPNAETELHYASPFQLLVAVVLSAQCTDKRVNLTTPALFEAFPNAAKLAESSFEELFPYIKSISFPANKTKHLLELSRIIMEKHGGEVPQSHEALLELPGVGRKTANVVTSVLFNEPRMAVDTHVFRVSARLGLTAKEKTPEKTEIALTALIPNASIPKAHHLFILHGRYVCTARNPKCQSCTLTDLCLYYKQSQLAKGKRLPQA